MKYRTHAPKVTLGPVRPQASATAYAKRAALLGAYENKSAQKWLETLVLLRQTPKFCLIET